MSPHLVKNGADDENRTHAISLEGWGSTIELHPHKKLERKTRFELATLALARRCSTTEPLPHMWWREMDSNHRKLSWRIYSPFPLATRESLHKYFLNGAGEENRTPNLLITNQLLYRWATPAYYLKMYFHVFSSFCFLQPTNCYYTHVNA